MNNIIVCDTPDKINAFRLLALKGALGLEVKGLRRSRGPSALSMVKREFGFKGSAASVLEQFKAHLKEIGVLV